MVGYADGCFLVAGRQGVRNADCMVRDNWYASVTWDEWEEGVRDHIDQLMARR